MNGWMIGTAMFIVGALTVGAVFCSNVSCNNKPEPPSESFEHYVATHLSYVKDSDTGICYAIYPGGYASVMATVPCSPEVEKRLVTQ